MLDYAVTPFKTLHSVLLPIVAINSDGNISQFLTGRIHASCLLCTHISLNRANLYSLTKGW